MAMATFKCELPKHQPMPSIRYIESSQVASG